LDIPGLSDELEADILERTREEVEAAKKAQRKAETKAKITLKKKEEYELLKAEKNSALLKQNERKEGLGSMVAHSWQYTSDNND